MWLWLLLLVIWLTAVRFIYKFTSTPYLDSTSALFINSDPWLRTVIHAVFILKRRITLDELREWAEATFLRHARFKQIIVRRRFLWPYWAIAPDFNVNKHLYHHVLAGEGNQADLERLVSELTVQPLKEDRPPWEFHLVDIGFSGGSALIFRVHHCMGDGVSLLRLALSELRKVEGAEPLSPASPTTPRSPAPRRPRAKKSTVRMAVDLVKAATKLLLLPGDKVSPIKPKSPISQSDPINVSWSRQPVPLRLLKQMAAKSGATVNDLLFTAVASGLRAYLQRAGKPLPRNVQAVLWVSMRGLQLEQKPVTFGNQLGTVYLRLPLEVDDPLQRLEAVRKQTAELVSSPEPFVAAFCLRLMGILPEPLGRFMWNNLAFKVSVSMSNLPGPQYPLQIVNSEIDSWIFFVPPHRTIGHFITVLSYNGAAIFGAASDQRLIEHPAALVELCHSELQALANILEQ